MVYLCTRSDMFGSNDSVHIVIKARDKCSYRCHANLHSIKDHFKDEFSKIYYYTSFQNLTLSGISVTPNSKLCMPGN
jgi:hypothetical protein